MKAWLTDTKRTLAPIKETGAWRPERENKVTVAVLQGSLNRID